MRKRTSGAWDMFVLIRKMRVTVWFNKVEVEVFLCVWKEKGHRNNQWICGVV